MTLAALHRTRQQQLALLAATTAGQLWNQVGPEVTTHAAKITPQLVRVVTAAQLAAATGAQQYVAAAVAMQGADSTAAGLVPAAAFAGVTSAGTDLASLLSWPAFNVADLVDGGMPLQQALGIGRNQLTRIVATQIQDAARVSTGVATVNERSTAGYIRIVSGAACSRCIILAGQSFRYDAAFARHPLCDCTEAPATKHIAPQSPKALFDAMTPAELKKAGWSEADVKAINDGADLYQVTNAHRGLQTLTIAGRQLQTTLHGTSRRGLAGQRLGAGRRKRAVRLTPESIYAEAARLGWSRDETIRQLKRNGYIL